MTRKLLINKINVVESLNPDDRKTGKELKEDCLYYNTVMLPEITQEYIYVKTKEDFLNSIIKVKEDVKKNNQYPIIHLEIHGNENGLELESGEFIDWQSLKIHFQQINKLSKNNLFLTLAVCKGAYLIDIISFFDPAPYWGFLAPREKISVGSIVTGFNNFYTELLQKHDLTKAFEKLNESLKEKIDNSFVLINCELLFCKLFRSYQIKMCSEPVITERVEKMYQQFVQQTGNIDDEKAVKDNLRMRITNKDLEEEVFNKYKNKFLMIDEYPEIENRFPFTYSELEKIIRQL